MDRSWEHKAKANIEFFDHIEAGVVGRKKWIIPVDDVIRCYGDQISNPPGLPQLVSSLNVNERSLRRHFEAMTGVSARNYLRRLRATRAVVILMLRPDIMDLQLNQQLGYAQPRSLRRAIAEEYGVGTKTVRLGSEIVLDVIHSHAQWVDTWWPDEAVFSRDDADPI